MELLTGMLVSSKKDLPTNFLWSWFVGLHCFLGLYYLSAYLGFFCGLMLGMYVMSVWPEMVDRLTSCPPAKTLTAAMATYLLAMLFSVWTTAYNFVPGGAYTRSLHFQIFVNHRNVYVWEILQQPVQSLNLSTRPVLKMNDP